MAELSIRASTRKPQVQVNQLAPVVAAGRIQIDAPPEIVWDVLTTLDGWPTWNPDVKSMSVQGEVTEGSTFRWKAGPGTVTSTIRRVEPLRLIAWTGRTLGIKAVHVWRLEPWDGNTFVRTEESFEGLPARVFRGALQKTLDRTLEDGLQRLKAEAERRADSTRGRS
jgi:uncharacterized protein YndB with AHSA1/START domain